MLAQFEYKILAAESNMFICLIKPFWIFFLNVRTFHGFNEPRVRLIVPTRRGSLSI